MRSRITWGGLIAGLVLLAGIATFIVAVYSSLAPRIDDLQSRFSHVESVSTNEELHDLPSVTRDLKDEVKALRERIEELEQRAATGDKAAQ